jgi:DNA polymerase elongation subunit (family B)
LSIKILTIDIETRPSLAYVWGLWDQNVALNQVEEFGTVISWAAKWHGSKTVYFASDYHDGHTEMVRKAWQMLDEADVVVGYNSRAFDMKHLNREFVLAGMPPPSSYIDVDLMSVVKQRFKFPSNKLQHIATALGLGSKLQHDGFDLWVGCMRGDEKSWKTMKKYNCQDVVLTEKVYDRLLPWIKNHPHRGLYGGTTDACPRCGHGELISRGYHSTRTGRYKTVQCKSCGGYSRSNKVEERVTETTI